MSDLSLDWGQDLLIDESGDFAVSSGATELQQRLVRRFLTNASDVEANVVNAVGDYVFDTSYGGNARRYVDSLIGPSTLAEVKNRLLDQINQEAGVSQTNPPQIAVSQVQNGILVDCAVTAANGQVTLIPQLEISS
jgi:hypothetical protein